MASVSKRETKDGVRFDVRFRTPAGEQRRKTFRTRREAERFARQVETDKDVGRFIDPHAGRETFGEYAARWLRQRVRLRPRTRELYEGLLRRHLLPSFRNVELRHITTSAVRGWHAELSTRTGAPTVAKAYRLMRTILGTALEDGLIAANPCILKGASVEHAPERPVASLPQVYALADAVPPRFRCMVLLACFAQLRLGELAGLRRRHVDLLHGTVRIEEQRYDLAGAGSVTGAPKSKAGERTVTLPPHMLPELETHLEQYVASDSDALVFTGEHGAPLRRSRWNATYRTARAKAGLPAGFRFHDLRGTGATLAAIAGATTRELMARLGHSSPRAALIYQHATRERDEAIARALSDLACGAEVLELRAREASPGG